MGALVFKKKYTWVKYACVIMVAVGIALFMVIFYGQYSIILLQSILIAMNGDYRNVDLMLINFFLFVYIHVHICFIFKMLNILCWKRTVYILLIILFARCPARATPTRRATVCPTRRTCTVPSSSSPPSPSMASQVPFTQYYHHHSSIIHHWNHWLFVLYSLFTHSGFFFSTP